jgi:hypothetical protein
MAINLRLARKGANEPRHGLVQQGNYHVRLASDKADALARAGWKKEKTSALAADVLELEGQVAAQADRRSGAKQTTLTESEARNQAKSFIRKLRNVLPIVIRDHPELGVTISQFQGGALENSTPKISTYLTDISEPVKKLDGILKDYLEGEPASVQLALVKVGLDEADTVQETTLAGLPEATLAIYETKGRVLEAIEDINRLAKNAFDGQAALIAQFNKDLLLRARKERKKPEDEPTE